MSEQTIRILDEAGREVAALDIEVAQDHRGELHLNIEPDHGLAEAGTDEDPEGVVTLMLIPEET